MTSTRNDRRIIIHFDYDCFYASVFEQETPSLKSMPLAVQQKQIIVTCNYEARRRGLHKLQLITEAKKICPDVVIVLGEELGRFRDASKSLYKFLESFTWSGKVEKLGFDEVWMDVTDLIDYNQLLLNFNDLENSFFQLKQNDPLSGFPFNATDIAGHSFPATSPQASHIPVHRQGQDLISPPDLGGGLPTRLILGSHIARYIRLSLDEHRGYTSTVGISTNKILSKLVGNLNKPKSQTTLLPPYTGGEDGEGNVHGFLDGLDIGKMPGVGFKMAQKIRNYVLGRPAEFEIGLIYGGTKEEITVADVRKIPGMSAQLLEKILGGPGTENGIGGKAWNLINGIDDTEVQQSRKVPTQISIEDSYIRLDMMAEVIKEMKVLVMSLIKRMHIDLLEDDEGGKRWMAHPKTLRLSTRPRPPSLDGTRTRSFNRISRSGPLPNFVFNLNLPLEDIVEKLVNVALLPMFRRLHPQQGGWNLSLMNVGVTNMVETASEDSKGSGRDISRMFQRQEEVLREWKVEDCDVPPDPVPGAGSGQGEGPGIGGGVDGRGREGEVAEPSAGDDAYLPSNPPLEENNRLKGSEDWIYPTQTTEYEGTWDDGGEEREEGNEMCAVCGAILPRFAMAAHERFHDFGE